MLGIGRHHAHCLPKCNGLALTARAEWSNECSKGM
jgi:hypothetical protein